MVQIDSHIPPPNKAKIGIGSTEAIRALMKANIGDSVLIETNNPGVRSIAYRLGGAGWFTSQKQEGGIRIWKIAEPGELK